MMGDYSVVFFGGEKMNKFVEYCEDASDAECDKDLIDKAT